MDEITQAIGDAISALAGQDKLAQIIIAAASLFFSIVVPTVVYLGQKRRESLDFIHAVRNMWISIDATVLQDPRLLELADSILAPQASRAARASTSESKTIEARQRSWLVLMILNAIYMDYLGAKKGFHSDRALDTIGKSLEKYLADDEFYEHTQNPGAYDDGFRKMCKRIKEKKPSLDKLVSRWIKRRCRICARLKAQWLNIKTRWAEQLYVFFSG